MTINEYQRAAMRTARFTNDKDMLLENGLVGLCGESGEAIDVWKKYKFQDAKLDIKKLKNELGDVAWYLAISCKAIGVTLEEVMQANIDKLYIRYPSADGFSKDDCEARVDTIRVKDKVFDGYMTQTIFSGPNCCGVCNEVEDRD